MHSPASSNARKAEPSSPASVISYFNNVANRALFSGVGFGLKPEEPDMRDSHQASFTSLEIFSVSSSGAGQISEISLSKFGWSSATSVKSRTSRRLSPSGVSHGR